jgi:hypothetical protein
VYSKSRSTLSQLMAPLRGGKQVSRMCGISLAFAMSSIFLVFFSSVDRDGLAQAVEGEAWSPLIDDAWTPIDNPLSYMTLSVIKSIKTSSTTFSTVLSSSDIQAQVN